MATVPLQFGGSNSPCGGGGSMQERMITMYCLCDEFLKAHRIVDHTATVMSTAEVMTTALVAADVFGGCFEQSRHFLHAHGCIPHRLSKTRLRDSQGHGTLLSCVTVAV